MDLKHKDCFLTTKLLKFSLCQTSSAMFLTNKLRQCANYNAPKTSLSVTITTTAAFPTLR